MNIFENKEYKSFNEFFTRKIKLDKRQMINNNNYFISPADSKLLVYKITKDCLLNIKGSNYTLDELVKEKYDLSEYQNGLCLIFRLSMDDYHHYCYPDSGKLLKYNAIDGKLHTVRSISSKYKIYKVNQREYSILEHSVGVALITWHFTRDKKQTLAALFHDISSPAFKHWPNFS